MNLLVWLVLILGANTPPAAARDDAPAMGFAAARHLLQRTGFGIEPDEAAEFAALPYEVGVRRLLDGVSASATTELPAWASEPPASMFPGRDASREEREAAQKRQRQAGRELRVWWYREMVSTESPLTERLVLFWHNHFTSSLRKVKSPHLMLRQNQLFRRHALGSFRELTHAVARDPAMVIYLDTQQNNRAKPNENFARELLELFTLGEGQYTEADIKEAARAFTGWKVNRRTAEFWVARRQHDPGPKSFLGQEGSFDGDQVIDIVLARDRVAVHLVQKLWREFISPTPDPAETERLAAVFRDSDYQLRPLMEALLLSPHFRAESNRGCLIKSPVELIVGTVRTFDVALPNPGLLPTVAARMGQDVFNPPSVKGWPGGQEWIAAPSLLLREQVLTAFLRGEGRLAARPQADAKGQGMDETSDRPNRRQQRQARMRARHFEGWLAGLGESEDERRRKLQALLLPLPPLRAPAAEATGLKALEAALLDPVYQLK